MSHDPDAGRPEIDAARAAGFGWISLGSSWASLEPTPGEYRRPGTDAARAWSDLDAVLRHARRRGMRVLLTVTDAPAWASGVSDAINDPPSSDRLDDYGAFLETLARTLGSRIDAYAAWNEPNLDLFWASPDPAGYVRLQRVAYRALRRGDPTASVTSAPIAGGSRAGLRYLARAYEAGLRGSVDVVAWTAYPLGPLGGRLGTPVSRQPVSSLLGQVAVREVIDRFDPGRPLWINEFGWSTCDACSPNAVSAQVQADFALGTFVYRRRYLANGTERVFWYLMRDTGTDRTRWEQNQGLATRSLRPKPALRALRPLAGGSRPASAGTRSGRLSVPAPPRRALRGVPVRRSGRAMVALGPLRVRARQGIVTISARVVARGGAAVVRVEGFTRRWRPVAATRVRGAKRVHVRLVDRGYLAVRLRASPPGAAGRRAVRATGIPTPPPAYAARAPRRVRARLRRSAGGGPASARGPRGSVSLSRVVASESGGRLRGRVTVHARGGRALVRIEGYGNRRWRPLTGRWARGRKTITIALPSVGDLAGRARARPAGAKRFGARSIGRLAVDGAGVAAGA